MNIYRPGISYYGNQGINYTEIINLLFKLCIMYLTIDVMFVTCYIVQGIIVVSMQGQGFMDCLNYQTTEKRGSTASRS